MLTHKQTCEFYIGARWANKMPSSLDLGIRYFTSSKLVKPRFSEFDIVIVAEMFSKDAALDLEKELLLEHWGNPNLLNRSIWMSKRFICVAHSDKTRLRMSLAKRGRPPNNKGKILSVTARANIAKGATGRVRSQIANEAVRQFMSGNKYGLGNKSIRGQTLSDETKRKISESCKGKTPSAHTDQSKARLSEIAKQRPKHRCMHCGKDYLLVHTRHHTRCLPNND